MNYARRVTSRRQARSAFTLIELLLVLVILAVLAGIVAMNFTGQDDKAKAKASRTSLKTIEGSIDIFKLEQGRYPTSEEGIRALVDQPGDVKDWHQYLNAQNLKDGWGRDFIYRYPGNHNPNSFDLSSPGKDGQDGTADDIDNWTPQ